MQRKIPEKQKQFSWRTVGIIGIVIGLLLILTSLGLSLHNQQEDARAGQEAQSILASIESAIAASTGFDAVNSEAEDAPLSGDAAVEQTEPTLPAELPTVTLNGNEYVGYLEIPSIWVKLPVMADWDYNKLKIAPCRQSGSSRTDDLVIAAHNYWSHFGQLKNLKDGEQVTFTDMDGIVNTYCVEKLETLNPDEVDRVVHSGYDLVLYTCTQGGRTRVVAFCNRELS